MRSRRKKLIATFLLSVIVIIYKSKQKKNKKWINRRWYVRPINQKRVQQGQYNNLFQELKESNDERMFFEYTRMSISHFDELLHLVIPHLIKKSQRALVPQERLIIALRYLVTGNSMSSIAFSFRIGQSTARNIVKEVCSVLSDVLSRLYMAAPEEEQWKFIVDGFWNRWQMPNCFGAIDGKLVQIKCPPNSVDVGAYEGNSDGGVFDASIIGKKMKNNQLHLPEENAKLSDTDISIPGFFIADAAFSLLTRIMKPYSGSNLTISQRIFNYRHSRARRTIETAFGILANRWQVFHTAICMLPETADIITLASVCLHNFVMHKEEMDGAKSYNEIDVVNTCWSPIMFEDKQTNIPMAFMQRDILRDYFVSPAGQVSFQYDYINRGTYRE